MRPEDHIHMLERLQMPTRSPMWTRPFSLLFGSAQPVAARDIAMVGISMFML